ncbi:MAG TPA: dihydrolipoyl dehydrogenase [Casimicrobiaceae bacterium]|nr:dihydrolipoyl dehydrogenase [Casimicrobiaceae bacterium]
MPQTYDIAVIGAGPGGYIAAIRAAQLGFNVACIDDWQRDGGRPAPGGTCTNVGCIPSKALLQSSEHYEHAGHAFAEHGIGVGKLTLDLAKMLARKDKVVGQNNDGILYLFKKHKIAFVHGRASFAGGTPKDGWMLRVEGANAGEVIAKHVVIATGSTPRPLPGVAIDNKLVLDNAGALAIANVPKRVGVVGAGVIGVEMGSVWRRLGSQVTMLEALPAFLTAADEAVAKEAQKLFTKQGLVIHTGASITAVKPEKNTVSVEWKAGEETRSAVFDKLIVAIGRIPSTQALNASAVGLRIDDKGFVAVDDECRTNLPQVWAIGDCVRGPMLAHKAEEEGVAVAERIAGQHPHLDFNTIPWVIYTSPEIAWVGKTEAQLKKEGVAYRAGSFPFMANGRARALGDTNGFVKMLADAKDDRILGMHVIGPFASELIAEGVVAMEFGAASEDLARICHAHPSLSEATREAALAVDKRALNF